MIVFVCPSKGKNCGIARYASYAEYFLRRAGIACVTVPSMAAVLALGRSALGKVKAIVVQHEYGLFDGDVNRALWAGESTGQLVARITRAQRAGIPVAVLMHTVDYLHPKLARRTTAIAGSGARVFSLNPLGAKRLGWPFFEHGVPLFADGLDATSDDRPHIVHFGFLSGMKRTKLLFDVAERLRLPLDINLAGGDDKQIEAVRPRVSLSSLPHRVTLGFADEATMIARWRGRRGVFLNPQAELRGYYATSGSTRFAMNFAMPVVCTGYVQHLGLTSVDCVSTDDISESAIRCIDAFEEKRSMILHESREKSMLVVFTKLIEILLGTTPIALIQESALQSH